MALYIFLKKIQVITLDFPLKTFQKAVAIIVNRKSTDQYKFKKAKKLYQ